MEPQFFLGQDHRFYKGQRLSYDGALCSVRYYGPLLGTKGQWLGVEWDETDRGKHRGVHQGQPYFQCLSSSPTAASFVRPSRPPDKRKSFIQALRSKYAPESNELSVGIVSQKSRDSATLDGGNIEISGKVVEEVGFDQIREQQAVLQDLRIVILDELCLQGIIPENGDSSSLQDSQDLVALTCPNIAELDIGWNLIETWASVAEIIIPLKKLRILKSSGLRLRFHSLSPQLENQQPFRHIQELHLNSGFLQPREIRELLFSQTMSVRFPCLKSLSLSENCLTSIFGPSSSLSHNNIPTLRELVLENNLFDCLAVLPDLVSAFPNLRVLSLQGNRIDHISESLTTPTGELFSYPGLENLNLASNLIPDYEFINMLPILFPGLSSLRVSNNPFFTSSPASTEKSITAVANATVSPSVISKGGPSPGNSHSNSAMKAATSHSDIAYSLTLARIPSLKTLNYTAITPRDREEGEIYYLSVAEKEVTADINDVTRDDTRTIITSASITTNNEELKLEMLKKKYNRYESLCEKYDRDSIFAKLLQQQQQQQTSSSATAASPLSKIAQPNVISSYPPGTLGSRLIQTHFKLHTTTSSSQPQPHTLSLSIPRTIDVYQLKALVSRAWHLPALQFRLIYESAEMDPVKNNVNNYDPSTWDAWGDWDFDHDDSSDSKTRAEGETESGRESREGDRTTTAAAAAPAVGDNKRDGQTWKKRQVELVNGTREWGFWIEDGVREVDVRVELF